jgi:hypothetical protein
MSLYKYKVNNYDEIINDPASRTGVLYGIAYDYIAKKHEFFTCEYCIHILRGTGVTYDIIASNAALTLATRKSVLPVLHEHSQMSSIWANAFENDNIYVTGGCRELVAVYPDDKEKMVYLYNKYLDKVIDECNEAKTSLSMTEQ